MTRKAIPVKKSVAHDRAGAGRPTTAGEKRNVMIRRLAKGRPGRPSGSAASLLANEPATKANLLAECRARFLRDFGEEWVPEHTKSFGLFDLDEVLAPRGVDEETARAVAVSKARKEIKSALAALRAAAAKAARVRDAIQARFSKVYGADRELLRDASFMAGLPDLASVLSKLPAELTSSGPLLTSRLVDNDDPRTHYDSIAADAPAFFSRARLAPRELACVLVLARRGRVEVRKGDTVQDVLARISGRFRQRASRARDAS